MSVVLINVALVVSMIVSGASSGYVETTNLSSDAILRKQGEEIETLKRQVAQLSDLIGQCDCQANRKKIENRDRRLNVVTTPPSAHQVAFYTYLTHNLQNLGTHHPIVFDHVHINEGNAYSSVDGELIAPVPGLYVFSWTIASADRTCMETELMKNQEVIGHLISDACNHDDWAYSSGTAVTRLGVGDRVYVRTATTHSHNVFGTGLGTSSFTGFLLH